MAIKMTISIRGILWRIAGHKSESRASVVFQPSASFLPQVFKFAPLLQCTTAQWRAQRSHFSVRCPVLSDEVQWPCVAFSLQENTLLRRGVLCHMSPVQKHNAGEDNSQWVGFFFFPSLWRQLHEFFPHYSCFSCLCSAKLMPADLPKRY